MKQNLRRNVNNKKKKSLNDANKVMCLHKNQHKRQSNLLRFSFL